MSAAIPQTRPVGCACAHNTDGSVTTMLCRLHADADPCQTMASVTGKRRKGTIRRGKCTNCGWTHARKQSDLTDVITATLTTGARADFEFYYEGKRWILTMAPVEG